MINNPDGTYYNCRYIKDDTLYLISASTEYYEEHGLKYKCENKDTYIFTLNDDYIGECYVIYWNEGNEYMDTLIEEKFNDYHLYSISDLKKDKPAIFISREKE